MFGDRGTGRYAGWAAAATLAIVTLVGLPRAAAGPAGSALPLPVDTPLMGRWVSADGRFRGRLEAFLAPVGDGEFELTFKVTGSPVFTPEGRPYPDEGVYPMRLERTGDDGLVLTYRQPFPRVRALFFVPRRLTYGVRLEGTITDRGRGHWQATVSDHNLALSLWVRPTSIAGTYDYTGRWEQAKGSFRMVVDRQPKPASADAEANPRRRDES